MEDHDAMLAQDKLDKILLHPEDYNPFTIEAAKEISWLRSENHCDACGGTGTPVSGIPCMCGGTGKMSDAAVYLRTVYVDEVAAHNKTKELYIKEKEIADRLYGDTVLQNTQYDEALDLLARAMIMVPEREALRIQSILDRREVERSRTARAQAEAKAAKATTEEKSNG